MSVKAARATETGIKRGRRMCWYLDLAPAARWWSRQYKNVRFWYKCVSRWAWDFPGAVGELFPCPVYAVITSARSGRKAHLQPQFKRKLAQQIDLIPLRRWKGSKEHLKENCHETCKGSWRNMLADRRWGHTFDFRVTSIKCHEP